MFWLNSCQKKTIVHSVGLITEKNFEDSFLVRFMRQKPSQIVFIFSDNVDESLIHVQCIIMCLPDLKVSQENSRLSLTQETFGVPFANFNMR